jgi:hypothetical protein
VPSPGGTVLIEALAVVDLRPGLQETWDSRTVAVFLEPISAADGT